MIQKQNLVPSSKYPLKCPHAMTPIGICVHNTANDATAQGEISYMVSNGNQTSFHFAVDDIESWQGLPLDRNGWHAGDGSTGEGNRKHIGIEICYSKSGGEKFDKAEQNTAELIAKLLKERNWGVDRVKKHQDFSGKYCPHRTLDLGWQRFLNIVQTKLTGGTMPETIVVNKADWEKVLANSITLDSTTDFLGLPRNSKFDEIKKAIELREQKKFDEGKASVPPAVPLVQPPEELTVNGKPWKLNGIEYNEGKLLGNYARR